MTGEGGAASDYISFGNGCLVGISAQYSDMSDSWFTSNSYDYTTNATTGACENGDTGPDGITNDHGYNCANAKPEDSSWQSYDEGMTCGLYYKEYSFDFNSTELCCSCGGGTYAFPSQLLRIKFHYSEGEEQGTDECEVCTSDYSFRGTWMK